MKEIIITYVLSYIIIIISAFIYLVLGYNDLNFFVDNICIYILLIYYLITIIYLYKKNKRTEKKLILKKYVPLISLGISIAIIYNTLLFKFFPKIIVTNNSLIIAIISSGIIGPIFEEIIFRYIFYNRLKKKYSIRKAIIINNIIFALIHINPIKVLYAFILGQVLTISYEKYKNIKAPIVIHIAANTIVLFLVEYNLIALLLAIINLIINILIITKE